MPGMVEGYPRRGTGLSGRNARRSILPIEATSSCGPASGECRSAL